MKPRDILANTVVGVMLVVVALMICGMGYMLWRGSKLLDPKDFDRLTPEPAARLARIVDLNCTFVPDWVKGVATEPHLYQGGGRDANFWFAFTLPPEQMHELRAAFPPISNSMIRATWTNALPAAAIYSPECALRNAPDAVRKWWYKGEKPVAVYCRQAAMGGAIWLILTPQTGNVYGFWYGV